MLRTNVPPNFSAIPPLKIVGKRFAAPPPMRPPMPAPALPTIPPGLVRVISPDTSAAGILCIMHLWRLIHSAAYLAAEAHHSTEADRMCQDFIDGLPFDVAGEVQAFYDALVERVSHAHEPDPDEERMFFSSVMSGAVWHNAVKPKLRMSGWHACDCGGSPNGECAFCGSDCLAGMDWKAPDYDVKNQRDEDYRCFVKCMECERVVEYVFIRNRDDVPADRVLYLDNPLTDAEAYPINAPDGAA